jgi:hypothetical protein
VRAVLDQGVQVAAGITVGGAGDITLAGHSVTVERDLPAGARQPEAD